MPSSRVPSEKVRPWPLLTRGGYWWSRGESNPTTFARQAAQLLGRRPANSPLAVPVSVAVQSIDVRNDATRPGGAGRAAGANSTLGSEGGRDVQS